MIHLESFEHSNRLKKPALTVVAIYSLVKFFNHLFIYPDYAMSRAISGIVLLTLVFLITRFRLSAMVSAIVIPLTLVSVELVVVLLTGGDVLTYIFFIGTGLLSLMYVDTLGLTIKMVATCALILFLLFGLDLRLTHEDAHINIEVFNFLGTVIIYIILFIISKFSMTAVSNFRQMGQTFSAFLDTSPNLIVIINNDENVEYISKKFAQLLGFKSQEEMSNLHLTELVAASGSELFFFDEIMGKKGYVQRKFEIEVDGKSCWYMLHSTQIREDGIARIFECAEISQLVQEQEINEINRQKEQDAALREIEKRRQLMLDVSPLLIQIWNKSFDTIDSNQIALDFYGYTKHEELRAKQKDRNEPEYQPDGSLSIGKFNAFLESVFANGFANISEYFENDKSGKLCCFEIDGLLTELNGEVVAVTYSADITQRREKDRFQSMLDSSPHACAIFDKDANAIDVNQAAVDFFGFKSKQDYIDNFAKTTPEFQPDGTGSYSFMVNYFADVIKSGKKTVFPNWVHQTVSGEPRPLEVTLVPIRLYDKDCVIVHALDLRDRLKLETALAQVREANSAKTRFLAHISHEVRTPLNAILGITQIELNFNDLPERTAIALERLNISATELLGLIDDLSDLSKIETGKVELNPTEYDVGTLISDTANTNIMRIGTKPIKFVMNVDSNLPSRLLGDELRIKQIINNLVSNAIKYTVEGEVRLSATHAMEDGEFFLIITVEDTGQGIKPDQLDKIFDEYFRLTEQIKLGTEGMGLGLSIIKRIIEAMDGKIDVESEYGRGSKFTATIKQIPTDSPTIGTVLAKQLGDFTFVRRRNGEKQLQNINKMPHGNVLVVDDVEVNLYVASGLLARYELNIDTAGSGHDTLEKIKHGKSYDIIFIDHLMPEMDGIVTATKLRRLGYRGALVALTATAMAGNADAFIQSGFDGFISKPINVRQLDDILNKFVKKAPTPPAVIEAKKTPMIEPGALKQAAIRDVNKAIVALERARKENNTKLLTVTVHGMKTGLQALGKNELSEMAAKLEMAAKKGDENFLAANIVPFEEELKELLENL